MLPLFGSTITSSQSSASTASTNSAIEGFIDWPPARSPWTPRDRKMRPMPSPLATATTLVTGAGPNGVSEGPLPTVSAALADPPLLLDLLEQIGDTDGPGTADVERGLDRRTDLVGVDVAVPDAPTADDHDRVAETGPHLLEHRDGLVGSLEEVHHLVAQTGERLVGALGGVGCRMATRGGGRLGPAVHSSAAVGCQARRLRRGVGAVGRRHGHGAAVEHRQQRVEQQEVARAAGVDHAGLLERRKHRRCRAERVRCTRP